MTTKRVILDFTDSPDTTETISKILELAGKNTSLSYYTIFEL